MEFAWAVWFIAGIIALKFFGAHLPSPVYGMILLGLFLLALPWLAGFLVRMVALFEAYADWAYKTAASM
jgi:putative effector of murein hydrolase LrgA (UPF0299 family)